MDENIVIIIISILGIISYFYLKSEGVHHDIKIKGSRMTITKYETKSVPNPYHFSVKAKSLQHFMAFSDKKIWPTMFVNEKNNEVKELLSKETETIGLYPSDPVKMYKTVTLDTAQKLLPFLTKSAESQIIAHGEKWGEMLM